MILRLLKLDYAIFNLPLFWILGGFMGLLGGRSANEDFAAGYGPAEIPESKTFVAYLLVQMIMLGTIYLASVRMFEIATPFRMALPIDGRDIWRSRVLGMLLAMVGSALVACGMFALTCEQPLHPLQIRLAFNVLSLTLLIPFLYLSWRPRRATWSMPTALYIAALAIVWRSYVWLDMRTLRPGVIGLSLAAVLAVVAWRRVPRGFEMHSAAGSIRERVVGGLAACFAWVDHVPGLRDLARLDRLTRTSPLFTRLQLALIGSLMVLAQVALLPRSLFAFFLGGMVFQLAWFARVVNGAVQLAHLPVGRGRVFAHAVLPGLALVVLGAALLLGLMDSVTLQSVVADPAVASGALLWAVLWPLVLSLALVGRATPPSTVAAWRWRWLTSLRTWLFVAIGASLLGFHLSRSTGAGVGNRHTLLEDLGAGLDVGSELLWIATLAVGALACWMLQRSFARSELVPDVRQSPG